MGMSNAQMRAFNNPVLVGLLLGASNASASFVGQGLFPSLPQSLSSMSILKMGSAHMRQYNLRRAPGAPTKRIELQWGSQTVALDQDSVEVVIPREVIRELDTAKRLNIGLWMEASQVAMATCRAVVDLSHELDCSELAANPATYASGMVRALSGGTKWTATTGTAVTDILAAMEAVREMTGRRANRVTFCPKDYQAAATNAETRSYLPSSHMGAATVEALKTILRADYIDIGNGIYEDDAGTKHDIWAGTTVVSYSPPVTTAASFSLGEPRFGLTSVMEGHPMAETPYYENGRRGWVYGATYERRPNVLTQGAAFLFQNAA